MEMYVGIVLGHVGHVMSLKGSTIQNFQNMACDPYLERKLDSESDGNSKSGQNWPQGPVNRIELARRASITGPNWPQGPVNRASTMGLDWPEGPVDQDRTGPKGQYNKSELAPRASITGPNWPEGLVQ